MTMQSPAAIYKRQQSKPDFDVDNNHQLIKATLEYLTKSLAILAATPKAEPELYKVHTARSLTAIYILQGSLDFDTGGAVATNLFQLYEYCRQHVLKDMRKDETANLEQAHFAMREILDAWQQIA
ncbi:flagellar protein FliS [Thalassobacter stenotrophicus]|uniref:Flagellar protein FliS n=2 Tax=Thalassobacter stenotrophicus TaxID=266809 RepID=A0A0P1EXX1_9RHOB|nr:flagellar protein FliS [Thalassobacter stenotrophicus]CUH59895.1 flagellar protein FliS [Thalassobacter stenotrophicus]SHJ17156.1 flagellar protein FliS [Thalassobacter stenotrophicus DSM 16310]